MTDIDSSETVTIWTPGAASARTDVRVSLPDGVADSGLHVQASGVEIDVREDAPGVLELTLHPDEREATITVVIPAADVVTWWTPGSTSRHAQVPPSWGDPRDESAFDGIPLGVLVRDHDRTRLAYAVDAGLRAVDVRAGLVEESAAFVVIVRLPEPGRESLRMRLDVSGEVFAAAAAAAGAWLQRPYPPRTAPGSTDPVLCTWYFAHLGVDEAAVRAQARLAAEHGFGTVIVDDGWQTPGTDRGYATTGDWRVAAEKFPDPRAVVAQLAEHGLRTLWWVGTPFIGHRSEAIGAELAILAQDPVLETAVLDPRDERTRAHLVGRVRELLETTGAAGLKLDFLERFAAPTSSARQEVMAAAGLLLEQIADAAQEAVGASPLIEYREPYVHPAVSRLATMVRVGDCPMSAVQNRLGIVDMRLSIPGSTVHSDPIMWGHDESDARVALHLINSLFGVPQISVDLTALSAGHSEVLSFWLAYWRDHRDLLLEGGLRAAHPERLYPVVEVESAGRHIVTRFGSDPVALPAGQWSMMHVVNADENPLVVLSDRSVRVRATVRDARGRVVERREATWELGAHVVEVPFGGLIELEALAL